ncbi:MAG: TIGR03087 family PEP-CTERM/XrtA system glycosyltransferase [bacterium]
MKILFLTHRIPYPPDKGDKIRAYHVLKHLARKHEVHLACLIDNKRDLRAAEELRTLVPHLICVPLRPLRQRLSMLQALITDKPLTVHYFYSHALFSQLEAHVRHENFDVLYVYSSNVADYVWDVKFPLRVIDFCDLDSEKFKQYATTSRPPISWLYRFEGNRLAEYEKKVAAHFDHVIFIGPQEKLLFERNGFHEKLVLMSNGVDFDRYYGHELPARQPSPPGGRPYVLFTGAMDYLPNIDAACWFAREVFPNLKTIMPELQFYIAGGNPVRKVRKLHRPQIGIFVTGYLDDLRPYIKSAQVFVAPMRIARGMQTKILEAMACGVPVVTSPAAARGIGANTESEVLVAETAPEYARQTLHLLLNKKRRDQVRRQAFRFLRKNFSWEENLGVLDRLLVKNQHAFQSDSPKEGAGEMGQKDVKPQGCFFFHFTMSNILFHCLSCVA